MQRALADLAASIREREKSREIEWTWIFDVYKSDLIWKFSNEFYKLKKILVRLKTIYWIFMCIGVWNLSEKREKTAETCIVCARRYADSWQKNASAKVSTPP